MILGIGIDSVEIERFFHWRTFSKKKLGRIFSPAEIDYCLAIPIKSAERFAIRFAVREAFFKAFKTAFHQLTIPFLTVCRQLALKKTSFGVPYLLVNWNQLIKNDKQEIGKLKFHVSCSHTKTIATVVAVIESSIHE